MKDIIAHLKLRIGEATDWGNKPDCDKVLITTSEASAIVEALEGKVWIEEAAEFKQEDFDKLIPDPSISNMNSPYQKLFDYMYDEHGVTLLQTDMQEIIRIVNEMDNWISVEDRLPDENQEVLLLCYNEVCQGFLSSGWWKGSINVTDNMNDGYVNDRRICNQGGNFDFVTHWQPLPKSPK